MRPRDMVLLLAVLAMAALFVRWATPSPRTRTSTVEMLAQHGIVVDHDTSSTPLARAAIDVDGERVVVAHPTEPFLDMPSGVAPFEPALRRRLEGWVDTVGYVTLEQGQIYLRIATNARVRLPDGPLADDLRLRLARAPEIAKADALDGQWAPNAFDSSMRRPASRVIASLRGHARLQRWERIFAGYESGLRTYEMHDAAALAIVDDDLWQTLRAEYSTALHLAIGAVLCSCSLTTVLDRLRDARTLLERFLGDAPELFEVYRVIDRIVVIVTEAVQRNDIQILEREFITGLFPFEIVGRSTPLPNEVTLHRYLYDRFERERDQARAAR